MLELLIAKLSLKKMDFSFPKRVPHPCRACCDRVGLLADLIWMAARDADLPGAELSLNSLNHVRLTVVGRKEQCNCVRFQVHY